MRGASGANRLTGPRQKGERVHVAAFAHVCIPAFHALIEAVGEGLILIGNGLNEAGLQRSYS